MAIIIIITDRYKRRRAVAGHYITINIIIIGIECADRIDNTLARGMDYVHTCSTRYIPISCN